MVLFFSLFSMVYDRMFPALNKQEEQNKKRQRKFSQHCGIYVMAIANVSTNNGRKIVLYY